MSIPTLILGQTGTGKSMSLRNLNPNDVLLIQSIRKPLPEVLQDEFTIDWSIAPEWANYWTIDLDCNSYWYRNKPSMVEYGWESNGGIIGNAPNFKYFSYSDKFRDSLRKRP